MKNVWLLVLAVVLASCASPVLRKDVLDRGQRDVTPVQMVNNPSAYLGRLFVLGGMIVSTRLVQEGSMIEALYMPVDRGGYLQDTGVSAGRFLAFYPKEKGILDPLMYREGREISMAGTFMETREGRIGEMSHLLPLFRVEDLYLWDEFAQRSYPTTFFNFGLFGVIR